MSRPNTFQIRLSTEAQFALETLATSESRSISSMGATLIHEALTARGIDLGAPPRPHAARYTHGAPDPQKTP